MPIPTANEVRPPEIEAGEAQDVYMSRCMLDSAMQASDPTNRKSICEKAWTLSTSTVVAVPIKKGIDGQKQLAVMRSGPRSRV